MALCLCSSSYVTDHLNHPLDYVLKINEYYRPNLDRYYIVPIKFQNRKYLIEKLIIISQSPKFCQQFLKLIKTNESMKVAHIQFF